jgi:hypothetical protein
MFARIFAVGLFASFVLHDEWWYRSRRLLLWLEVPTAQGLFLFCHAVF